MTASYFTLAELDTQKSIDKATHLHLHAVLSKASSLTLGPWSNLTLMHGLNFIAVSTMRLCCE